MARCYAPPVGRVVAGEEEEEEFDEQSILGIGEEEEAK